MVALLLAAQGVGIFAFGCWPGWARQSDGDLRDRAAEYALFREGVYPNAHLERHGPPHQPRYTVYPPYVFPLFALFFEPGGKPQGRFLIQSLSLASVVVMGLYAFRRLAPYGAPIAMVGATAGAAIASNYTALSCGQFSIICVGLVVEQLILLERRRPLAAGLCWTLAMIKPQIALPFALLFLLPGRLRGLGLGAVLLVTLSIGACLWTGVPPGRLLQHWTGGMSLKFLEDGVGVGPGVIARSLHLGHRGVQVAAIALLALAAIPAMRLLRRHGQDADLPLAGACAVAGIFGFYHRHYDNIMLFPTLLTLLQGAAATRRVAAMIPAAALMVSLMVHRRFLDGVPFHDLILGAVWAVAGLVSLNMIFQPGLQAAKDEPDAA